MTNFQTEKKIKCAKLFLLALGGYYLLILNQHFNIPLRYIPWALIFFAFAVYGYVKKVPDRFIKNILVVCALPRIALMLISLTVLTIGFTVASFNELPAGKSLYDVTTIFLGPIFLGLISVAIVPRNLKTVDFLCAACVLAVLFLALTDTLHYARDWYRMGRFADDGSHRWFGDGYIFFLPWLLLAYIKAKGWFNQVVWLLCIFWIFLLMSGTGSRAVMIVVLIEITLFMSFYRRKSKAFFLPIILAGAFGLGALLLAPQQIAGAIQRGTLIQNRVYDAWLPVLDFIRDAPWLGHGFGPDPWNKAYAIFLNSHPAWPGSNFGSPHNLMLDVAFVGGVISLAAFVCLCILITWILFGMVRKSPFEIAGPALATLCSFIDFYLVRGLVESIRFEPLGITLMWVLLLTFINKQQTNLQVVEIGAEPIKNFRAS
jgi:O-antigen ligase